MSVETTTNTSTEEVEAVLPLLITPRAEKVSLVESIDQLRAAIAILKNFEGPFALDAERASGFKYSQRAYLIQVHRRGSPIFLIDPISISPTNDNADFTELADLLSSDIWILHAATQDIPCLGELGLVPSRVFDTELGSRIAGLERVGLSAVTEKLLGLRLAKEHSAVDWSTRPLRSDWLNYAALDVDVLLDLHEAVTEVLVATNKIDWALQEFAHVAKFKAKGPNPDKWRAMSGLHEVKDSIKLAIARSVWIAREQLAQKLDVSPGRLIPDASIVAVAKDTPRSRPELSSMKSFAGRASRSYIDTWWGAIQAGYSDRNPPPVRVKSDGIPNHRTWPNRFPEAHARLVQSRELISARANELNLPQENLITPDFIRALCWQPPVEISESAVACELEKLGARDWQIKEVTQLLIEGLAAVPVSTSTDLA